MANHYCMFKGKLKFGVPYLDGYNGNPHYAIVVEAPDGSEFVVLANVKSDSTMPGAGEAGYHVLYQWTQDFKLPMTADLAALEPGLHQDGFPRIDYVRDAGMVDFPNMQPIALDTATEHNDINALVDTMLTLDRTAAPIDYVYHGSSGDDDRKGWPPRAHRPAPSRSGARPRCRGCGRCRPGTSVACRAWSRPCRGRAPRH